MKEIPQMGGRELDALAGRLGLKREKKWWFIKESDASLRSRVECRVCQINHKQLTIPGIEVG